jgi:hypothetical protein
MHSQPSTNTVAKKVNHTSHCHQPSQSSSSNQPSYQNFNPRPEYQSHYQRYPSQYYQPYNYTPHTNQVHSPQPTITYPPAPLQIMYRAASSQATQPKIEPKTHPTSITKPRFFSTSHQFPNLRNYTHYHQRLQHNLRKQETKARALSPS